jgi:hypothetical protein
MDLPINDDELALIVRSLKKHLNYHNVRPLCEKLKLVKEVRDEYPDGPYKKILREQYGMVI